MELPAVQADLPTAAEYAPRPAAVGAPMRILLATPWDLPFGGVASVIGNLARDLTERGDSAVFLHLAEDARLRSRRTSWGFPGYTLALRDARPRAHPVRGLLPFALTLPFAMLRLGRLLRRHRIQLVNIHYPVHEFLPLALCCRLLGVRLVTSVHGSDFIGADGRPSAHGWPLRWLIRASDLVVAPSESCRGLLAEAFPGVASRAVCIYNGLHADAVTALDALPAPRADADYVLCIASLGRHKGTDVLLRAFAALAPEHSHLRLALLGDGAEREQMEALARQLGITERVEFLGERGRTEVARLLRGCLFLVLPSRAEAFGLVSLEAMAAGRAVVASAAGGIPEVVQDGVSGLLVPPGDAEALAQAMERLLCDPSLRDRLAQQGKQLVRTRFDSATTARAYAERFRVLLHEPASEQRGAKVVPLRRAGTPATALAPGWTLDFVQPPDWEASVAECGGGYFHTPAGLAWGAPGGQPVFARLWSGGSVVGVALGASVRCRLGRGAAHLRFPGAPAIRPGYAGDDVAAELVRSLASTGAAEVELHGFDGDVDLAGSDAAAHAGRWRHEYRLALAGDEEALLRRCSSTQRRHIQRGVREGWSFRALDEAEAGRLLEEASAAFAERRQWTLPMPAASAGSVATAAAGPPWGTAAFGAFAGDDALAVVIIGWGYGRAFYLRGGSTADGYRRSAAPWLQWRVMSWLRANGIVEYNLGGAPATATAPEDAEHGLHRFKSGFGAELVACRGATWHLHPAHLALHRAATWGRHHLTAWRRGR